MRAHAPLVHKDFGIVLQEWALLPNNTIPNTLSMEFNWLTFNGKAWPHNERLTLPQGDSVHFRVVNAAAVDHPLHLHGFYIRLLRRGGERADSAVPPSHQALLNMHLMPIGGSATFGFAPTTPGNWAFLPKDFAPWQTVYGYFRRWTQQGLWERINEALVRTVWVQAGRDPNPSAASIDSQSGKTSEGGEQRGIDVHKQTPGRKRHIGVDVLGLLLMVLVHSASIQDGRGGYQTLQKVFDKTKHSVHNRWCRLKLIWADGGYASIVQEVRQHFGWQLDIVRRSDKAKGFEILPHRWIVERTFGWLGRYRRATGRDGWRMCWPTAALPLPRRSGKIPSTT